MKKFIFAFLVVGTFASASAQQGFQVGVNLQPQTTWIFNQEDFDAGSGLEFRNTIKAAFGATVGYNFSDQVGVFTGITYSSQGQNYRTGDDNIDPNFEYSTNLTYLKIPVALRYNSSLDKPSQFLLHIGPQFGLLSGANRTLPSYAATVYGQPNTALAALVWTEGDVEEYYNSMDISAMLGLGLQVRLAENMNISLMFKTDYSISDIENEEYKLTQFLPNKDQIDQRNSANNLTLGFNIGFNYIIAPSE